jgi:CPA1 family monovalent cation:H+ antiporter
MTPVAFFELILLLMGIVVALELTARRLQMPPAAALILGGIVLALIPGTPNLQLNPDLALVLFLPPLLVSDAFYTAWRDFRANLRVILQLAIGAVVFTTLLVGVVAHVVVPGLPWAACFALGAIVSPPDAVAAKAVLQNVKLPQRLNVMLEGESLLNDASGLVLFRFAVAASLTGAFSITQAAVSFVTLALGGVVAGVVAGFAIAWVLRRLRDPILGVIVTLLWAWAAYIVAEALHVSGVLAAVSCGLLMGWQQHSVLSAETRLKARAVWETVGFVLESMVFILIGLSLRGVLERLGGWQAAGVLLPTSGAVVLAVVVTRFLWIFPAVYVPRALLPALRRRDPYPPVGVPIVLSWAGMRGVVSLAAALALPQGFPGRDFILATTFAVIMVTVLVQGATLAPLIRRLGLAGYQSASTTLTEAAARARMAEAQLAVIEKLSLAKDGTQLHPRLLEQYGYRARASARFAASQTALEETRRAHFTALLAAIAAGRAEVLRMHQVGDIHDHVLQTLEEELDLEEMSARRLLGDPA